MLSFQKTCLRIINYIPFKFWIPQSMSLSKHSRSGIVVVLLCKCGPICNDPWLHTLQGNTLAISQPESSRDFLAI